MGSRLKLRDWRPGVSLAADRFQEPVTGLRELQNEIDELRRRLDGIDKTEATERSDQTEEEQRNGLTRWRFVEKTTVTERLEDADNSDVYIDVERTTSITVQIEDGTFRVIEFE